MVDSVFPPSGTVEITYLVKGRNLNILSTINVDLGFQTSRDATISRINDTCLQFVIGGTLLDDEGLQEVRFITNNRADCDQSMQLDLKQRKC